MTIAATGEPSFFMKNKCFSLLRTMIISHRMRDGTEEIRTRTLAERKEEIRDRLARTIRRLRKERRLSQRILGEIVGLHQAAFSRVERGEQGLGAEELVFLADALRVSLEEIFGVTSPRGPRVSARGARGAEESSPERRSGISGTRASGRGRKTARSPGLPGQISGRRK